MKYVRFEFQFSPQDEEHIEYHQFPDDVTDMKIGEAYNEFIFNIVGDMGGWEFISEEQYQNGDIEEEGCDDDDYAEEDEE